VVVDSGSESKTVVLCISYSWSMWPCSPTRQHLASMSILLDTLSTILVAATCLPTLQLVPPPPSWKQSSLTSFLRSVTSCVRPYMDAWPLQSCYARLRLTLPRLTLLLWFKLAHPHFCTYSTTSWTFRRSTITKLSMAVFDEILTFRLPEPARTSM
jgi:hypothetical protein